jgi:cobalt-precorrin-5B (C1)-methyltransferase
VRGARDGDGAVAVVVKDAGDDPDVTHGAHLTARVTLVAEPGIVLRGGEGVGTVTKPGLGLEVGGPAINKGPRAQITAAVGEVVDLQRVGVEVEISVPGGEKMGRRTSNPRLGIMGGISILGTTGIVRPFSTAAWRASVGQAIDVMDAQGSKTVVLTTGGRTEKAARKLLPELPEVCFVEVGDFTGYALKRAAKLEFERCVFVGMAGKLAKLAAGIMMTHWTRSKVDPLFLADVTREAGGDEDLATAVAGSNTGRHAWELWEAAELFAASDLLCTKVADNLTSYIKGALLVDCAIVDFEGARLAGASPGARERLQVEALAG